MGRVYEIIFLICLISFLSGCTSLETSNTSELITPPQNRLATFDGKWKIARCITKSSASSLKTDVSEWVGKVAEFSSLGIKIGDNIWINPGYKVKSVNTEEFFFYNYGIPNGSINISEKEINVITVTSDDTYICDVIKLENGEGIAVINDNIFSLQRISDKVDTEFSKELAEKQKDFNKGTTLEEDKLLRSGLLLGICTFKGKNEMGSFKEYSYRTLWISSYNRVPRPLLETKDIFIPRKSGFWKLAAGRVMEGAISEDIINVITPYQLVSKKIYPFKIDQTKWNNRTGILSKKILFAGNDYISTEISGSGNDKNNKNNWKENIYKILPIDNIANLRGLNIFDAAGENGLWLFNNSREKVKDILGSDKMHKISQDMEQENIALYRKNGHWMMKGRINYQNENDYEFQDFNINLIPPQKLVAFDDLCLQWTAIKDKVPEALDAYTSPNREIAIILTSSKLMVYSITNGHLSDASLQKIRLSDGDAVVMAEWATGEYVENWEKNFMGNEVRTVEELKN